MLDFILSLALFHAPVVYQELGSNPLADRIVAVNFDGDWVANNNWHNIGLFPTKGYAYYEVFETTTHFYLFYAFFHSRDYSIRCLPMICHENDLEGAMILVRKDGTPFGKSVLLQTLAHNRIYSYPNPALVDVDEVTDPVGRSQRMALYIEAGGHGVYIHNKASLEKINKSPFVENARFLIYQPGVSAEDVGRSSHGKFKYELLNIYDHMWSRRNDVGRGKLFLVNYTHGGSRWQLGRIPFSFAGERWSPGMANPPWAWHDPTRSGVRRGDWFLDPAHFVRVTLSQMGFAFEDEGLNFSSEYLRNPYLQGAHHRSWSQGPKLGAGGSVIP